MPKLAAKDRKKVESAEVTSGGFEPLEPGKYVATLGKVETRTSGAGNPYWNVEFEDIHDLDGNRKPGRQWYTLMLPTSDTPPEGYTPSRGGDPKEKWAQYQALCAGRIKGFFEAFGYSVDSDTDEMLGEKVILQIGIETIQKGAKAGEKTNRVNNVFPLDSVDGADEVGDSGGKDKDDF